VTQTSFQVRAKGEGFLVVLPVADPGSVVFSQRLNGFGVHKVVVQGLLAGTEYRYGLTNSQQSTPAELGRVRTWKAREERLNIGLAGCAMNGMDAPIFTELANSKFDMFIHLGDMHYQNIGTNEPKLFEDAFDMVHGSNSQRLLFQSTPLYYMWDDHDYGPNDSNMLSESRPAALETFKKYVPHPSRGPNVTYYAFSVGTTRFVMLDTRSESIPGVQLMSKEQLAWLLEEIRDRTSHKLLVLSLGQPWVGEAKPDEDGWLGHPETRKEVSKALARAKLRDGYSNVIGIASDQHSVSFDDGSNTDFSDTGTAGFPLIQAGPLGQEGSCKGGPYTAGCFGYKFVPNSLYATMEITDPGESEDICVSVTLRQAEADAKLYQSKKLCGAEIMGSPKGPPGDDKLSYFPMFVWVLLVVYFLLLGIAISCWVVLLIRGVRWQQCSSCAMIACVLVFSAVQLLLFALNVKSNKMYQPFWQHLLFCIVLELPVVIFVAVHCLAACRSQAIGHAKLTTSEQ